MPDVPVLSDLSKAHFIVLSIKIVSHQPLWVRCRKLCNAVNLRTITCYKSVKKADTVSSAMMQHTKFSTKGGGKTVTIQRVLIFYNSI